MGWYRDAFGADYLARYAHRDDAEAARAVRLSMELGDFRGQGGLELFDLCCGAGRHLAAMIGYARATGLPIMAAGGDLSPDLLRAAKARDELRTVPLLRLDMREIPLRDASLDLVTNFFTAFGYFEDDAENFRVLSEVARVLRPGGCFVLDFLNGAATREQLSIPSETGFLDGAGVAWRLSKGLSDDGLRSVKVQQPVSGSAKPTVESVRLYTHDELRRAFAARGLRIIDERGDYEGSTFEPATSPRYFVVARRD